MSDLNNDVNNSLIINNNNIHNINNHSNNESLYKNQFYSPHTIIPLEHINTYYPLRTATVNDNPYKDIHISPEDKKNCSVTEKKEFDFNIKSYIQHRRRLQKIQLRDDRLTRMLESTETLRVSPLKLPESSPHNLFMRENTNNSLISCDYLNTPRRNNYVLESVEESNRHLNFTLFDNYPDNGIDNDESISSYYSLNKYNVEERLDQNNTYKYIKSLNKDDFNDYPSKIEFMWDFIYMIKKLYSRHPDDIDTRIYNLYSNHPESVLEVFPTETYNYYIYDVDTIQSRPDLFNYYYETYLIENGDKNFKFCNNSRRLDKPIYCMACMKWFKYSSIKEHIQLHPLQINNQDEKFTDLKTYYNYLTYSYNSLLNVLDYVENMERYVNNYAQEKHYKFDEYKNRLFYTNYDYLKTLFKKKIDNLIFK